MGGAVVAGGIAAMHYTGMAAFEIEGVILWDPVLVAASIVIGAVIGAIALPVGLHGLKAKWNLGGATLLTLAICSHHFTAMAAVGIIPDPTITVSHSALPAGWLAIGVAMAGFAIIGLALAGAVLDIRDRRRSELEVDRMRDLANASVEGLLVCDGETIVSVNTSFAALTGLSAASLVGARLDSCFPDRAACAKLLAGSKQPVETSLRHIDGTTSSAELILRPSGIYDRPHHVVAVRVLRAREVMARLGGDEFAILMPGIANPAAASRLAETILEALRAKSDAPEINSISASIGIAICPDDAATRETLLTQADTALYRAKTEGRNTYRFFEAGMGAEVRERRLLEHDLRLASARGELRLVYQPQADIQSRAITGFEALLRWTHSTRGEISPAAFIPIAEETGSILEIGDWVMKSACREAATWTQPLSVAVNVSAVQLYNPDFVKELHQILLETGLSPSRLEIEITETALVRDFDRALMTLRLIKALGIRIAMDDFGTGYSSLSNLRAFPFDKIKIDGSFIRSVNTNGQAATIVRAVLGLGRGLGLPVLAEGVETDAELDFLQEESCDIAQGYLLGRPAEIGQFRNLTHIEAAPEKSEDRPAAGMKVA
jgi:EAL domain-containing protein (putative c-di-GMP-specific phosphodiesterase class I)/PAS domain-containing protein